MAAEEEVPGGWGPVFASHENLAYVKTSKADLLRLTIDMSTKTLTGYQTPNLYPADARLRCDRSVFVPVFCTECFGTSAEQYASEIALVATKSDAFVVGTCSVYGLAEGDVYPESRTDFIVPNELAFSGACHPMPGKALFGHQEGTDIGTVACYWHVHSRASAKTFLYCCVARAQTAYAQGVVTPETAIGFSLGTMGTNTKGNMTEECSLVAYPMRPGCFCVIADRSDLGAIMTRMGFSQVKAQTLDAGYSLAEQGHAPEVDRMSAEIRVLKDMLSNAKIQLALFTRLIKNPDQDALFTMRGAQDFTRRTGSETRLCAGAEHTDSAEETMAATKAQMDEVISLLRKPEGRVEAVHEPRFPFYQQQAYGAGPSGSSVGTQELTADQRRDIAMLYNKEEEARTAVHRKRDDTLLASITSSIRAALQENKGVTQDAEHEIRMVTKGTPYKREVEAPKKDTSTIGEIMLEIKALQKGLADAAASKAMVVDPVSVARDALVKQQAGYTAAVTSAGGGGGGAGLSVSDFIAAVVL